MRFFKFEYRVRVAVTLINRIFFQFNDVPGFLIVTIFSVIGPFDRITKHRTNSLPLPTSMVQSNIVPRITVLKRRVLRKIIHELCTLVYNTQTSMNFQCILYLLNLQTSIVLSSTLSVLKNVIHKLDTRPTWSAADNLDVAILFSN